MFLRSCHAMCKFIRFCLCGFGFMPSLIVYAHVMQLCTRLAFPVLHGNKCYIHLKFFFLSSYLLTLRNCYGLSMALWVAVGRRKSILIHLKSILSSMKRQKNHSAKLSMVCWGSIRYILCVSFYTQCLYTSVEYIKIVYRTETNIPDMAVSHQWSISVYFCAIMMNTRKTSFFPVFKIYRRKNVVSHSNYYENNNVILTHEHFSTFR